MKVAVWLCICWATWSTIVRPVATTGEPFAVGVLWNAHGADHQTLRDQLREKATELVQDGYNFRLHFYHVNSSQTAAEAVTSSYTQSMDVLVATVQVPQHRRHPSCAECRDGGAPCAVHGLCPRCAKSRLFSTTSSHGSQGPEFCTPDAVLN